MDVLKKEMEGAFASQQFDLGTLDDRKLEFHRSFISSLTKVSNGCAVLTDMARDRSYFSIGNFGSFLGMEEQDIRTEIIDSLDEDCIYDHMHLEDLSLKRHFELDFFFFLMNLPVEKRLDYKASCKIRMRNIRGEYTYIANQTQIVECDELGNVWLALCQYDIAPNQHAVNDIENKITNCTTGDIISISLQQKSKQILSNREIEILFYIKEGWPSKEISDHLFISINTVNRHRQNIIEKLQVSNSLEAVNFAQKNGLL